MQRDRNLIQRDFDISIPARPSPTELASAAASRVHVSRCGVGCGRGREGVWGGGGRMGGVKVHNM